MNNQAIFALATHLTGPDVAHHSIGLEAGGLLERPAKRFFELREQFGISGYMDIEDAKKQIVATLEESA